MDRRSFIKFLPLAGIGVGLGLAESIRTERKPMPKPELGGTGHLGDHREIVDRLNEIYEVL